MKARAIQEVLREKADPEIAEHSQRFFKTGKGEYGEGDRFLGIRVPVLRKYARQYRDTPLTEVAGLLKSSFHEERLTALLILVLKFAHGNEKDRSSIYRLYLKNTAYVNNWDLVDSSAHHLVGAYLEDKSRTPLYRLMRSDSLWERRMAIMATYHFIKRGDFEDALALSEQLIDDREDLIHKATGWMLREVGNRDRAVESRFLGRHYRSMPRR